MRTITLPIFSTTAAPASGFARISRSPENKRPGPQFAPPGWIISQGISHERRTVVSDPAGCIEFWHEADQRNKIKNKINNSAEPPRRGAEGIQKSMVSRQNVRFSPSSALQKSGLQPSAYQGRVGSNAGSSRSWPPMSPATVGSWASMRFARLTFSRFPLGPRESRATITRFIRQRMRVRILSLRRVPYSQPPRHDAHRAFCPVCLRPVFVELIGMSARRAAEELNRRGISPLAGDNWFAAQVIRVRKRLNP